MFYERIVSLTLILLCYFEVFTMYVADGYGIASEFHYQLTIAQYAHYVTFLSASHSCQYSELDMVFGKLHEWISQERDSFRLF